MRFRWAKCWRLRGWWRSCGGVFRGHSVLVSTTTDTGQELARQAVWRRECVLFPDGFCVCDPAVPAGSAAGIGGDGGDGILAELSAAGACQRGEDRSGQCANLRPVVATLPPFSWLLRRVLANVDLFLAQTAEDAARLRDRLAPKLERVQVTRKFEVRYSGAGSACDCGEPATGDRGGAGRARCWFAAAPWKAKNRCC